MTQAPSQLRSLAAVISLQWRSAPLASATGALLNIAAGAAPAGAAWLMKCLLDEIARGSARDGDRVIELAVAAAIIAVAASTLVALGSYVDTIVRQQIALRVDAALFGKVIRLPGLEHFENPAFHGRIKMAERAALEAPQLVAQLGQGVLRTGVTVAALLGVVLAISPVLAGALVLCGLTATVAQWLRSRADLEMLEQMNDTDRWRDWYRELLLDVRAAKEIRLYGTGDLLLGRMTAALRLRGDRERAIERRSVVVQTGLSLAMMALASGGAVVLVRGDTTIGDVTLFFAAVVAIENAFSGLLIMFGLSGRILAMFGRYREVLALPEPAGAAIAELPPLAKEIRFEDVWFRYTSDTPWVLRGVSLVIPAGRTTGLVGINGAGKSTLIKLLCGFYRAERGRITWDGTDLADVDPRALRRRISGTFQDFMTYDLTAHENIGLGDIARLGDREAIRAAARLVDVDEAISSLPRGYDTLLSRVLPDEQDPESTGTSLSGGLWQRMAIARGLVRQDVDLVVLDEPSSGLDPEAEHALHETVQRHGHGRARVLISHRLSALRDADQIAVLSGGAIAELGTHAVLMAAGGDYARLFTLQAAGYQDAQVAEAVKRAAAS